MKKKGFTLIELLAVIVILAVIALIATPMILGVIETARKGAAEVSANGYMEALELYISTSELENKTKLKPNQRYNLTKTTLVGEQAYLSINELVDIKGDVPTGTDDYIVLGENYKITEGKLTLMEYVVTIQNGEKTVTKGEVVNVEDITLNFTSQTMEKGSTTKIEVTFTPNNASNQKVNYKSSNDDIVSVEEDGTIKALQNGNAVITVKSEGNKDIEKTVNVEVITSVESITLTKEDKETYIGDTNQLTATITPGDATTTALTWSSSDESIATVSESGLVTGLKVGTVTITATTKNRKTSTIDIEIKPILAESITIGGNSEVLVESTTQLTATVLPENTTNKTITWSSSDESVATVSESGLVAGLKTGTVTITATTSNGVEITKTIEVKMPVCKRADVTTLHTETCEQTNTAYSCSGTGYETGSTITYGNETVTSGLLQSGDAFDCDVDGSGTYDADERFYYVSDLYNTTSKTFDSDYAVLVYYNNTTDGLPGSSLVSYDDTHDEEYWYGPITAKTALPTTLQWSKVSLTNSKRAIISQTGATTSNGQTLPTAFSYDGYATRLLTYQEIDAGCDISNIIDSCEYLFENTGYSKVTDVEGYWLENPQTNNNSGLSISQIGITGTINLDNVTGVRPVIEVPKSKIQY